jgi:large subunit ribosomal protein L17
MMRNLAISAIENGTIKSTITKTKAARIYLEKIVTIAKNDSVGNRRLVFSKLNSKEAVNKLFTEIAPKYKSRPGGYLRITRFPTPRLGDGADLAFLSFV